MTFDTLRPIPGRARRQRCPTWPFGQRFGLFWRPLDDIGIAFLPEDEFSPHLDQGRLLLVLEDWWPPFPGFHLYYPSRRHPSPAFSLVLDALRYRPDVK